MSQPHIEFVRTAAGEGLVNVETVGLEVKDHAELQMVQVPEGLVPVAERFLSELAFYATTRKAVHADETIGVPTHFGANFARLVTGETVGQADVALRVVDVDEDAPSDGAPLLVLATELFEEAFQRYQRGEIQIAAQLLQASVEVYPGSEGMPDLGVEVNNENFRAHLLLYTLSLDPQHLDRALRRSSSFQFQQLGAPIELLDKLLGSADAIRSHAELLRKVRLATWDHMVESNAEALEHPVAPLPQPQLHTDASNGALMTALSLVPTSWAETFYRGPGRLAVDADEAIDLVVDVLTHFRGEPAKLISKLEEASTIWSATEVERGPMPEPLDRAAGVEHLITSVLAEIGVLAAIGLDPARRRAWFELGGAPGPTADEKAQVTAFMQERQEQLVEIIAATQQAMQ